MYIYYISLCVYMPFPLYIYYYYYYYYIYNVTNDTTRVFTGDMSLFLYVTVCHAMSYIHIYTQHHSLYT